eukprot:TRINITY_DN3465_c0_g1_i2.p1 TRINITY_DN3465_c0_g1~~TRINITY_DN3465_c0_g1_i2.p1  ORF type:complete len:515 (+),score=72.05 TRINITY_DN3465_c0_g1_i2:106-1650(+)
MLFVGKEVETSLSGERLINVEHYFPTNICNNNSHPLLSNTIPVKSLDFFTKHNTTIDPRNQKKRKQPDENLNVIHPLQVDKYLYHSTYISSYLSFFKSQLLVVHTVSPLSLSLDFLLPFLSPSPPAPSPHLLCLYTALAFGSLSLLQRSAAQSFFLLALETLQSLPITPSITLSSSVWNLESLSWYLGSNPVVEEYLKPCGGGQEPYSKVRGIMDKNDTRSYVAVKMKMVEMMKGENKKEERLKWVLKTLEEGVEFNESFDNETRKEVVFYCFLTAHCTHIFGVMVNFKRQNSKTPLTSYKNNNNKKNGRNDHIICTEYRSALYTRLGTLEQVNENSAWKQKHYRQLGSVHNRQNSDQSMECGGSYWETKLSISALKYLVSVGQIEREERLIHIDSFLDDLERLWFCHIVVIGPMIVEALIEEGDWGRCDRMMARIEEMEESGRMSSLRAMIEQYSGVIERGQEEARKQGRMFQEVLTKVDANKGVFTTSTWRCRDKVRRRCSKKKRAIQNLPS